MSIVVERCPLCRSGENRFFEHAQDGDHTLTYQLCESCGMVFQSPRLSERELDDFYRAEYRRLVQGDEGPSEKDLRVQAGRAGHLLTFAQRHLKEIHAHLDIGSSAGMLLRTFQRAYGCLGVGIEPGDAYREYSQELGLQVVGDLEYLDQKQVGSFDLVTMAHVLEHLADPVAYLRRLRKEWIASSGHLLVEVPNLYGHSSLELAHLLAFSPTTLRLVLEMAGYQVLTLEAHGRPRSRIIQLYITALAFPLQGHIPQWNGRRSSRKVFICRKLGMTWNRWVTRLAPRWAWLPWPDL